MVSISFFYFTEFFKSKLFFFAALSSAGLLGGSMVLLMLAVLRELKLNMPLFGILEVLSVGRFFSAEIFSLVLVVEVRFEFF